MDRSKIKNFIIIALMIVNAFLLLLVMLDHREKAAARRAMEEAATLVLEQNGIAVAGGVDLSAEPLPCYTLGRDLDMERQKIRSLLGEVRAQERGGNIYSYSGDKGQASFRGTGEFEVLMNKDEISTGRNPAKTATKVLEKLGVTCKDGLQVDQSDDAVVVTALCTWRGSDLYNVRQTLTFSREYLILIEGQRPFDMVTENEQNVIDCPTALMKFLEIVDSQGVVCTQINEIEQGYMLIASVPGDNNLVPVWRICTDTGDYYINGITGKPEDF